ncbi:hypothetical protein DFP72DRAFT_1066499 [Ephemerocybe angulata]|uniref:Uncharacterized protein n=1 Tax=Ephemerocybe angulata TaxID=980116 RepID=A0A8H6M6H8_9AGAR|nr:hypothetical protein DFP72DRAFT_1066499 [Tulosesus angulatus]
MASNSNSRWAQRPEASSSSSNLHQSSTSHPFSSSSPPVPITTPTGNPSRRRPTGPRREPGVSRPDEESFLWLSTSYNTEGSLSNPLHGAEEFTAQDFGSSRGDGPSSTLRTTLDTGKASKDGYYKMASSPTLPLSQQQQPRPPEHPRLMSRSQTHLNTGLDAAAIRSSWTSTDSEKSDDDGQASITQSDFEFLTPSFIAMGNPPLTPHGLGIAPRSAGVDSSGAGGKGGALSVPGSQRPITGDSHTLGRLHNLDRESSVLPPSSVRSGEGEGSTEHLDSVVEHVVFKNDRDGAYSSLTSPTLPLNLPSSRKPSLQARDPSQSTSSAQRSPPKPQQRYYHQPAPRQEQPLRHATSDDSTGTSATGTSSSRQPLSSTKSNPQIGSSGGPTYPPTAYAGGVANLRRQESQSKASGYSAASGAGYIASGSASPSTSVSASYGGAPPISPSAGGNTPSSSIGGILAGGGGGRGRGNSSASESKHPYANSSAYRMAATTDDSSGREAQHPFSSSYKPSPQPPSAYNPVSVHHRPRRSEGSDQDMYSGGNSTGRTSGHEGGYSSEGSGQPRYIVAQGSAPSSNKPSPMLLPRSKPSSNTGHGGEILESEVERDSRYERLAMDAGRANSNTGLGLNLNDRSKDATYPKRGDVEKGGATTGGYAKPPGPATTRKEKRQSAGTLLSLRIRNIYPVNSSSPRTRNQGQLSSVDSKYTDEIPGDDNVDMRILRSLGMACIYLLLTGVIPLLGAVYVAAGHAVLRAKAQSDFDATATDSAVPRIPASTYLRASISSSARAGAVGGAILAVPLLLLIFVAIGPDSLTQFMNATLKWLKLAASPSVWIAEDNNPMQTQQEKEASATSLAARRRSRRASSLWGPNAASASFKEQSSSELAINVTINVFLAILFLCLGAACAALGVTILSPDTIRPDAPVLLSVSTAALAGLVGGAVIFGGVIIIAGVLAFVIYEGGKPVPVGDQQMAAASVPMRGVNVDVPSNGKAPAYGSSQGASLGQQSINTFLGGQQTVASMGPTSDGRALEGRWL